MLYFCRKHDIELEVYWRRDIDCNVAFEDILVAPKGIKVVNFYRMSFRNRAFFWRSIKGELLRFKLKLKSKKVMTWQEWMKVTEEYDVETYLVHFVEKYKRVYITTGVDMLDDKHFMETLDREFMVNPKIIKRCDEILSGRNMNRENLVGVHIRRTDHRNAIENSPLEAFFLRMDEIRTVNPSTIFYLATDDLKVKEEVENKGYHLICSAHELSRASSEGIKEAFVDMLCLSRCGRILGSYGSTFSHRAAMIGRGRAILERITKAGSCIEVGNT